jgi:hypothetical protein
MTHMPSSVNRWSTPNKEDRRRGKAYAAAIEKPRTVPDVKVPSQLAFTHKREAAAPSPPDPARERLGKNSASHSILLSDSWFLMYLRTLYLHDLATTDTHGHFMYVSDFPGFGLPTSEFAHVCGFVESIWHYFPLKIRSPWTKFSHRMEIAVLDCTPYRMLGLGTYLVAVSQVLYLTMYKF